jgi:hypothetical protein
VVAHPKNADEKERLKQDREARLQRRKDNKEECGSYYVGEKRQRN